MLLFHFGMFFPEAQNSTLKYEFSNREGGRLFSHRTWGRTGEGVWFSVTLPTCDFWLGAQRVEWKALRSSWLHSAAQEPLPDFSGQFKSAQTLACSLSCAHGKVWASVLGGLTPYQNSLSEVLMNGDEWALLRAQGLHLSCEIKCSKASLVLGMSGTAGLASNQMFFLQNRAVTHIPTTRGQRSRLWPAVTGESSSWHGPSCCLSTVWTFKEYKWSFASAWTNALGLLSLQGGPTAAVPAHQGAQCWEDPAAEHCRMHWSSLLAEQCHPAEACADAAISDSHQKSSV